MHHPQVAHDQETDVEGWLRRKFEGTIRLAEVVMREDLDLVRHNHFILLCIVGFWFDGLLLTISHPKQKNHLSGIQRKLLKVSFWNVQQLNEAKREIAPIVARNRAKSKTTAAYADLHRSGTGGVEGGGVMAVQVRHYAAVKGGWSI